MIVLYFWSSGPCLQCTTDPGPSGYQVGVVGLGATDTRGKPLDQPSGTQEQRMDPCSIRLHMSYTTPTTELSENSGLCNHACTSLIELAAL
jgi:hypothetical protein